MQEDIEYLKKLVKERLAAMPVAALCMDCAKGLIK